MAHGILKRDNMLNYRVQRNFIYLQTSRSPGVALYLQDFALTPIADRNLSVHIVYLYPTTYTDIGKPVLTCKVLQFPTISAEPGVLAVDTLTIGKFRHTLILRMLRKTFISTSRAQSTTALSKVFNWSYAILWGGTKLLVLAIFKLGPRETIVYTNIANAIFTIFARFNFLDRVEITMGIAKLADFQAIGADVIPTPYIRIPTPTTQERETVLIGLGEGDQLSEVEVLYDSDNDWVHYEQLVESQTLGVGDDVGLRERVTTSSDFGAGHGLQLS